MYLESCSVFALPLTGLRILTFSPCFAPNAVGWGKSTRKWRGRAAASGAAHARRWGAPRGTMQAPLVAQPYQRPVGGPRFYPGSHNNEPPSDCGKCCFPICEIYRYDGCGGALWGAVAWAAVWGVITSPTGGWGVVCGPARYAFRCWTPEYAPVVAPPNPVMKFFCPLMEVWRYEKNPCDGGGDCEPFILPFIGQIIPCIGCCYTMLCWNPEYRDATTASSMNAATAASMPMMQQPMMMMQPMAAAQSNDMGRGDLNDLGVATSNGLPFGWEERDHPSGQKQYCKYRPLRHRRV